tara:strand:+ start:229 stop:1119 length:891 start_codon:yes stop_codon:yes gene_type:complete
MKKIMYVFVVTSIFLFSCTKDDAINDVTRYYDPSQLNEIQENAIGVVEQYTVDNIKNLKAGKISKTDFYDNLADTLAQYLHVATAVLDWTGIKGGIPLDVCMGVLTSQRDSFANINIAIDTIAGVTKQSIYPEDEMSSEYNDLRKQHIDLRHAALDFGNDLAHSEILRTGLNTLDPHEYNFLASRINPILGVHEMFESGKWDNLKDLFDAENPKFFSCIVAACVAIGASEACAGAAVAATIIGGTTTAAVNVVSLSKGKDWGLPAETENWKYNHINSVFASCASLLDLVENHLDTE